MSESFDILVTFPGGKKVDAEIAGHVVRTDQPKDNGGDDSAPSPFNLFLASIGTCAGIYVLGFLRSRELPTEGVQIRQAYTVDEATHVLKTVTLEIRLPPSVPEKYHPAIIRAADMCAVKKAIHAQPTFDVRVVTGS